MEQRIDPDGEVCNHEDYFFNGVCYECNNCGHEWGCIEEEEEEEEEEDGY